MAIVIVLIIAVPPVVAAEVDLPVKGLEDFAAALEELRAEHHVPAFSAAIAKGDRVVWSKGFGLADREQNIPASPETTYHIASLTKTFASAVLLMLSDEGKLDLEAPVARYGVRIPNADVVRVRHLLTHTSDDPPGANYRYDGNRFAYLDAVMKSASGKTFAELVCQRVIHPLKMAHTAPNVSNARSFACCGLDAADFERDLAKPYDVDERGDFHHIKYPVYFNCSGGLISSVTDIASYSMALDRGALLKPALLEQAFTPAKSTDGTELPYALGWFVTSECGVKLVWHYGLWTGNSALLIKAPERKVTFVLLANSDGLSKGFRLGTGQLMNSPFARAFVNGFVAGSATVPD